jgi:phosphoglycerate-specific signal transduction histidine kinase
MTEMSNLGPDAKSAKAPRASRAKILEARLAELEKKTKELRERLREEQRKEREENSRAVAALHKTEGLDVFDLEAWAAAMPQVKALLEKAQSALPQEADA